MYKFNVCYVLLLLVVFTSADESKNGTQTTSSITNDTPKETSDPAPGVADFDESKNNQTDGLSSEEKMKGFLKLYNFAIKHGKLNLTETLKNLTNLNESIPEANLTKALSGGKAHETKTNATAVKLPSKNGAKIAKKPDKGEEAGSGDEKEGKEKSNNKNKGEETWDESWDDDDNNGNGGNNYHDNNNSDGNNNDEYNYGNGNGHGFAYTNDNGDVNGHGYQYQYDNAPDNAPATMTGSLNGAMNGGIQGGIAGGIQGNMVGGIQGGMVGGGMVNNGGMMGAGAFAQGDSFGPEYAPHEGLGDTHQFESENPSDYNQQGFVNFDDGATQMVGNNGNYDKKKHIHKLKKQNKRHHNNNNNKQKVVHLHTNAKHHHSMKENKHHLVTVKKQQIAEGNGYRRTIMIGNRVCGAKKSTNVQTRNEIHMQQENDEQADDNMVKRDIKGNRANTHTDDPAAIRATDQCCADHNECSRIVPAKATKFGYSNDIEYDVMACNCDSKFRNCLKNANSFTADAVGHLYFNTLKIPCLTFEHDSPEQKSEQPEVPQETSNTVSIVPDVESDRETVGGAQLVVAPASVHHSNDQHQKEAENEHEGSQQMERVQHEEMVQLNNQKDLLKETQQNTGHSQEFMREVQQEAKQQELLREAQQHQHTQEFLKEAQKQAHGDTPIFHVMKENIKDEENEEQPQQQQIHRKNHRPQTMNPNPKPENSQNSQSIQQRFRGVATPQEAYSPRTGLQH